MVDKILIVLLGIIMVSCMESDELNLTEDEKSSENKEATASYLALGDSYTIGQSVAENERFPAYIVDSLDTNYNLKTEVKIIATTGWRTDDLLNAIERENPEKGKFDFITLLIGVNNQYQGRPLKQYKEELETLINLSIDLLEGKSKNLILVSIPDYGVTPFAASRNPAKIREEIDAYNAIKQEFATKYNLRYVYITDLTRAAKSDLTLLADDQLHPSGKLYAQWVERILPEILNILNL